jgi:outer membrane protein OmpA-like peptidoglycan-associated protein
MRIASMWVGVGITVAGLGACTTALPPERTEALGPPYNEAVKQAYVQLAAQEEPVLIPATAYRRKARDAMLGDMVWPDKVGSHPGIPPDSRPEALAVRERLVTALVANATERVPEDSARAVASFDCWLYELESRTRGGSCEEVLMAALPKVETAAAAATVPKDYQVFFPSGGAELDAQALAVIETVAQATRLAEPAEISVVGFADPTGSPSYNQTLSERRADSVAEALMRAGVPAERIVTEGLGPTATLTEPAGRRVDITLVP